MNKLVSSLLLSTMVLLPLTGVAEPARRIVSLDLCTDWMLARYADPARVAALSPLNRQYAAPWPDAGWPVHDGTLERILQLKPDLVVTGEYNALLLRGRLQTLGVKVEILPLPKSLKDVTAYEKRLLELLDIPADRASQAVPAPSQAGPSKRLLLLGPNGIGTGQSTFENDILERAGWTNYLRGEGYIRLDLERIVADPPDAILASTSASRALASRFAEHPVLQRAVPREHWLTTDYWRWQCPGPWTWDLVRQLHQWLN
ncbi:ABC transporter substrate-binding protein [Janthinobacterium sp. 17J80-10]|uniref:ABC transporter substrate-binding protein n=1 Tax=Janthinobacterium sp. 17J80-10 TaxID=2497863 RepID=UPI0010053D01|nr:ABC transporter substrate-binding protein [Janthinobacterium sp. 17J80-10]QAU34178.1 ABC transporter substrate-binding protein [Janthinobacterium sp. 17J80-10]